MTKKIYQGPLIPSELFIHLLQMWISAPGHFNANYADFVTARDDALCNQMEDHAFSAQCAACSNHDTLDHLGEIQTPCLLTVGDADIFTPLRCSQEMHARLPNSQLDVFHGLGHCHHWEDLDRFNNKTTIFLLNH